jgi:hypothetical protein
VPFAVVFDANALDRFVHAGRKKRHPPPSSRRRRRLLVSDIRSHERASRQAGPRTLVKCL